MDYKFRLFKNLEDYYKKYDLFVRLEHIPFLKNVCINLGIKIISMNDLFFKISVMLTNKLINFIM
jgi:hypothetical protein